MIHSSLPRLVLIRHGDTAWTETGQHTGRTDLPLNEHGERRAERLSARLAGESFSRVFSSPLRRARRTCELAGLGEGVVLDDDLVEWDYGRYDGLTGAEIRRSNPDWQLFRDGAPDGESPREVAARADRFVARARSIPGDVAAFGSGHILRMIAARWLGLEAGLGRHFFTSTASVGVLGYEHDRTQPVVLLWNDAVQ